MERDELVIDSKRSIPNIPKLISPMIDVGYNIQKEYGDVNLKKVKTKDSWFRMSKIALNSRTSKYYSEDDCTYTIVKAPH